VVIFEGRGEKGFGVKKEEGRSSLLNQEGERRIGYVTSLRGRREKRSSKIQEEREGKRGALNEGREGRR